MTEPQPQTPPPSRSASSWLAVAAGMILLIVLLVFILQNLQRVKVSFFMVHWRAPLAVDLLFATVLGGLVVFTAGTVHILQLRREARRHQQKARERGEGDGHEGNAGPGAHKP